MNEKKVSIAMATYNGGRYLRKQLDSLYEQTYKPFEIVVCDDNSKDETQDILEEYRLSKGLRYYINETNLGVTKNFYKAISKCEGDYVMISDQDDIWLPNKIEETLKHMIEIDDGKPSLVSSLSHNIDSNDRIIGAELPDVADTQGYQYIFTTDSSAQGCSLMLNWPLIHLVFDLTEHDKTASLIMYDYFIGMAASLYGNKYNCGKRLMLYRHHDKNVVAKARGERSFFTKVRESNRLVHFLSDEIFEACMMGSVIFNRGDENPKAKILLDKVVLIGNSQNYIKQIFYLFSIKELALSRKMKIAVENLGVRFIKLFVR